MMAVIADWVHQPLGPGPCDITAGAGDIRCRRHQVGPFRSSGAKVMMPVACEGCPQFPINRCLMMDGLSTLRLYFLLQIVFKFSFVIQHCLSSLGKKNMYFFGRIIPSR